MHKLITKKVIETIHLSEGRELLLRDTELKGFGIRISPSGVPFRAILRPSVRF